MLPPDAAPIVRSVAALTAGVVPERRLRLSGGL